MALLKYFKPTTQIYSCQPQHGTCSNQRPDSVVSKKNFKRGKYNDQKISQEATAEIGKYASENGISRTMKHFKDRNLKASTVRDWRASYLLELKKI